MVKHYLASSEICKKLDVSPNADSNINYNIILDQGRATFSERGSDETFRSSSWAGVSNENPKMRMYIPYYNTFICKAGKSVRRLVVLAMKKYFNVRLDGWARQQSNVIEVAVGEQGAMARLRVGLLHFLEELFAIAGDAKHGYGALNMRNVFRKSPRREGDVAEEGQWRRVVELCLQFMIAL